MPQPQVQNAPQARVDDAIVWFIAFTPLLYVVLTPLGFGLSIAVSIALNVLFCHLDGKKLKEGGYKSPGDLAGFLVPTYLLARPAKVNGGYGYAIAWFIVFFISIPIQEMAIQAHDTQVKLAQIREEQDKARQEEMLRESASRNSQDYSDVHYSVPEYTQPAPSAPKAVNPHAYDVPSVTINEYDSNNRQESTGFAHPGAGGFGMQGRGGGVGGRMQSNNRGSTSIVGPPGGFNGNQGN